MFHYGLYQFDKFSFILRKPVCFDETTFMDYSHVFEFNIDICLQHSPKAAVWARKWNQMKQNQEQPEVCSHRHGSRIHQQPLNQLKRNMERYLAKKPYTAGFTP